MIDPSIRIDETPIPDDYFDDYEPSRFEINTVMSLTELMTWHEEYEDIEEFYESIVLSPDSDYNLETADMKVIGADPDSDSVIVCITGRVF